MKKLILIKIFLTTTFIFANQSTRWEDFLNSIKDKKLDTGSNLLNINKGKSQSICTIKHPSSFIQKKITAQWILRNLSANETIAHSNSPFQNFYGASIIKVFAAGALSSRYDKNNHIPKIQKFSINNLIARSNNQAWRVIERSYLKDKQQHGAYFIQEHLNLLGICNTLGYGEKKRSTYSIKLKDFQNSGCTPNSELMNHPSFIGKFPTRPSNMTSPYELSFYIQQAFNEKFYSEPLMRSMFYYKTGSTRSDKYLSNNLIVGGKTGTWKLTPSQNLNHSTIIFLYKNNFYSLTIFTSKHSKNPLSQSQYIAELTASIVYNYVSKENSLVSQCTL